MDYCYRDFVTSRNPAASPPKSWMKDFAPSRLIRRYASEVHVQKYLPLFAVEMNSESTAWPGHDDQQKLEASQTWARVAAAEVDLWD